jgi:hypothetical protein
MLFCLYVLCPWTVYAMQWSVLGRNRDAVLRRGDSWSYCKSGSASGSSSRLSAATRFEYDVLRHPVLVLMAIDIMSGVLDEALE